MKNWTVQVKINRPWHDTLYRVTSAADAMAAVEHFQSQGMRVVGVERLGDYSQFTT